MTQYINKDTLVAELNRLIAELVEGGEDTMFEQGRISAFEDVKVFINHTLEVKEVDLKAELNTWRHNHFHGGRDFEASGEYLERITQLELAKHFFEIGLNSQRKISYVPNIDDSLKELGVDPDSKEAKIFKESYYTALEKLKAQKGE